MVYDFEKIRNFEDMVYDFEDMIYDFCKKKVRNF